MSITANLWHRVRRNFDWTLLTVVLVICAVGLLNLYSCTRHAPVRGLFVQQIVWMTMGLCTYLVLTVIDYRAWHRFAWLILAGGILAVMATHLGGVTAKGAQRWIGLGGLRVQPSEFVKVAVILAVARFVHDGSHTQRTLPWTLAGLIPFVVAVVGIALQPDLGTATLCALIMLSVAFVAMRQLWIMGAGCIAFAAAIPPMWQYVLHDYQKNRVLVFMDPMADPTGTGWHAQQSLLAIGSGRVTGKGWMQGTQNQLAFLPEQWTDFPFSVWAEEWGLFGVLGLLGLFLFLILWILYVGARARDRFGLTICIGAAAFIFWHVFVNIAMVTGLAPVVGVTLPLVSYGGSSLLTTFVALGLVSSVAKNHATPR